MFPSLSRRTSTAMAPPPVPPNPSSPNPLQVSDVVVDNSGVGVGPGQTIYLENTNIISNPGQGPLRHPRPLTASEIYLECEKEQEGIV